MITNSKKILFATDLSKECQATYIVASKLAMALNKSIVLLHVIKDLPISIEERVKKLFGEDRFEEIMQEHEDDARSILIAQKKDTKIIKKALQKFCEESNINLPELIHPDNILVKKNNNVANEILSTARETECNLIILSPHENISNEISISGIIKKVVKMSPIPTLIIPPKNPFLGNYC